MKKFVCREDYPVVQTEAGKLRGYEWDGSVIFKGVKYADAKRFMRPALGRDQGRQLLWYGLPADDPGPAQQRTPCSPYVLAYG